ncbi:MAG TPA: helix-turn-helix transcriptional regulator [Clostridia bacterium]|nr:helix-turn-helix transcriptional regulator [Clostridia bacterium]
MFIAKNLKRLRLDKGLTQEELASHVGVTGQAVSKWERDESYPDITLLPGLAHCFGVTIDELLGMAEIKGKMWGVYARANTLKIEGKYHDAAAVFDEALKVFPADLGLAAARAEALALAGEGIGEAIGACERLLEGEASEKRRATVTAVLCFLYHATGETEKAEVLARNRPHACESRELLLPNFLPPAARTAYLREHLPRILTAIAKLIDGSADAVEEKLRQITLGIYKEPMATAEAIKKIAVFLSES